MATENSKAQEPTLSIRANIRPNVKKTTNKQKLKFSRLINELVENPPFFPDKGFLPTKTNKKEIKTRDDLSFTLKKDCHLTDKQTGLTHWAIPKHPQNHKLGTAIGINLFSEIVELTKNNRLDAKCAITWALYEIINTGIHSSIETGFIESMSEYAILGICSTIKQ